MTVARKKTPIRGALEDGSSLLPKVKNGIEAIIKEHRRLLSKDVYSAFGDSIDLDAALEKGHEGENRWDYLLGHTMSTEIVAIEPHTATQHEVKVVIAKRKYAKEQLSTHLKSNARITKWLWVASGKNHFADTEKTRRILDQNGILFVCPLVLVKHLPSTDQTKRTISK